MIRVEKPWGHEVELFAVPQVAVWRLNISAGHETSLHYHARKDVLFIVEQGEVEVEMLKESLFLTVGDKASIGRRVRHRLRAGAAGAVLLEIETPDDKQDLTRIDDRYGRAGIAYVSSAA